jgi:hypothetical protein
MKNINKEIDEEIRQDFENELRDVAFDFKKLIINSTLPSYDEPLFFDNWILRCSCRLFIWSITSC